MKSVSNVSYKNIIKNIFNIMKEDKKIIVISVILALISSAAVILATIFVGDTINLFDENIDKQKMLKIVYSTLIILGLYFIFWICHNRVLVWAIKLSYRTGYKIRNAMFTKILDIPVSYIDKQKSGELMSRSTNDIDSMILNMSQILMSCLSAPIIVISCLIAVFILSPLLSLVSLFLIAIIAFSTYYLAKRSSPQFDIMQEKVGELNALNKENIVNRDAIYIFQQQNNIAEKYKQVNDNHKNATKLAEYRIGMVYPLLDVLENIFYGVIYTVGFVFIINNVQVGVSNLNLGSLATFVILVRLVCSEIGNISRFASLYQKLFASAKRVFEILELNDDIDEGVNEYENLDGDIEFKNVNFSYIKDKPVIKNFNLKVKKGSQVAIVGPTGSGKTTLINLLMRFYELDSGQILIDGKDTKTIKKENLRKFISIVLQDTHLFSETINQNIAYGNHEIEMDQQKIIHDAKEIGSDHFIELLPKKYETILDSSISLSSGEAQLLGLTRAYYSPSNILILDEATSSIDSTTEKHVQKGMLKLMKGKTTFVIAHRLSTIVNSDLIIVMKNGEILEQGNHKSLLRKKGFYWHLYNSNALEENE